MRKLYLLLDEWKNDRNFVGSELEEIKKYFDVTVICNDFDDKESCKYTDGVCFYFYNKKKATGKIKAVFKALFDSETWKEIKRTNGKENRVAKVSEIIRFYINAELFYNYMKQNGLIQKNLDAIYYSYWYFWKCFAISKHRKEYQDIRVITRAHGYDLYKDQIPTKWQPFKQLMDNTINKIVFISEHGMDYYFEQYTIQRNERHALYKLGTYNNYGLNPEREVNDAFRIVSCSSVIELKRVNLVAEALELIDDANIEWIHYGDGELFDDLKEMAYKKLGEKKNISFVLPGHVSNADILNYYSAKHIDAFIMTSRSEGNPISVIEAMSFGIPVIATNINNMPNLVKGNGILISANPDSEELAYAIKSIINMKSEEMRIKSRLIWEEEFKADNNIKKIIQEVLLKL